VLAAQHPDLVVEWRVVGHGGFTGHAYITTVAIETVPTTREGILSP
jgi:hypothetical protein